MKRTSSKNRSHPPSARPTNVNKKRSNQLPRENRAAYKPYFRSPRREMIDL